jgi:acyl-ACP thioesterase
MKSIEFRVKKAKYILRVTDKSGIFHLGNKTDYEQKVEAYRQKTGAYIELGSDPLWTVFEKVVHLLNNLRLKDQIRV